MFSFISKNWRGKPLMTLAIVVSLIASTTTREGLVVQSGIDTNEYAKGIKVTDEEIRGFSLSRDEWHGDWNYVISPSKLNLIFGQILSRIGAGGVMTQKFK